jgi:precorrin-8X/cobalt-precorrin-8 methylmutase
MKPRWVRRKKAITITYAVPESIKATITAMTTVMPISTIICMTRTAQHKAAKEFAYLRDPAAIYRRSFALIRRETDLAALPRDLRPVALRLVHASGEPALVGDLIASAGAAAAGRKALADGAEIIVDAAMVAAGITGCHALCMLNDKRVPGLAKRLKTTRSAAAVELWRPHLDGAVVAIGNAPTALFHLLEIITSGAAHPALILGFPVGFVGAAEAKEALARNPWGMPFIALAGRRGGSALAAAAVNALVGQS